MALPTLELAHPHMFTAPPWKIKTILDRNDSMWGKCKSRQVLPWVISVTSLPPISYKKETFTITSEEKRSSLWAL